RAMYDRDRLRRQLGIRIELCDCRVVPGLDFAEEHLSQRRAIKNKLARNDAGDVYDRNNPAHYHRELHETTARQIRALERRIGSTEDHGLRLNLFDAAARAD